MADQCSEENCQKSARFICFKCGERLCMDCAEDTDEGWQCWVCMMGIYEDLKDPDEAEVKDG